MDDIIVTCHAPSLSCLLYETVRSSGDQVGLLVGKICREVVTVTTDEDIHEESNILIYVKHCIPLEHEKVFTATGGVIETQLQSYLDMFSNNIVGWYSYRRHNTLSLCSMKDTLIHRALLKQLPDNKKQLFLMALLTSTSIHHLKSTHSYYHVFKRFIPEEKRFVNVKLKINTLSDKCATATGYLSDSSLPTSSQFDKIINSSRKVTNPVDYVQCLNVDIKKTLDTFVAKLLEINKTKAALEQEVALLKESLGYNTKQVEVKVTLKVQKPSISDVKLLKFDINEQYNPMKRPHPFGNINVAALAENLRQNQNQKREVEGRVEVAQVHQARTPSAPAPPTEEQRPVAGQVERLSYASAASASKASSSSNTDSPKFSLSGPMFNNNTPKPMQQ